MNKQYSLLLAIVCSTATVLAQNDDIAGPQLADSTKLSVYAPSVIKSGKQTMAGPAMLAAPRADRKDNRVFRTHPMPNGYRGDNAIPMPNAYQGDNCVTMPNVYQERPASFITVDSLSNSIPDSALMGELKKLEELEKVKGKLKKEQRLRAD